ncbi:hypothetical protein ACDX78_01635 [Virgibacillus oceani]
MNFRLRQLHGCLVKLRLEENKEVHGEICFVGSDFVEIKMKKSAHTSLSQRNVIKHHSHRDTGVHHRTLIIPIDSIKSVKLDD